jgi:hypothetical protein
VLEGVTMESSEAHTVSRTVMLIRAEISLRKETVARNKCKGRRIAKY